MPELHGSRTRAGSRVLRALALSFAGSAEHRDEVICRPDNHTERYRSFNIGPVLPNVRSHPFGCGWQQRVAFDPRAALVRNPPFERTDRSAGARPRTDSKTPNPGRRLRRYALHGWRASAVELVMSATACRTARTRARGPGVPGAEGRAAAIAADHKVRSHIVVASATLNVNPDTRHPPCRCNPVTRVAFNPEARELFSLCNDSGPAVPSGKSRASPCRRARPAAPESRKHRVRPSICAYVPRLDAPARDAFERAAHAHLQQRLHSGGHHALTPTHAQTRLRAQPV
jgi:hypothetical protein